MALTCSWENPLGTCFTQYDKEKIIGFLGGRFLREPAIKKQIL